MACNSYPVLWSSAWIGRRESLVNGDECFFTGLNSLFHGGKLPSPNPLVIAHNFTLPLLELRDKINSWVSGRIIAGHSFVGRVLRAGAYSKIADSIVCAVAVFVIKFVRAPFCAMVKPNDSVNSIMASAPDVQLDMHAPLSVIADRTSNFSSVYLIPTLSAVYVASLAPAQDAGFIVTLKKLAHKILSERGIPGLRHDYISHSNFYLQRLPQWPSIVNGIDYTLELQRKL